MILAARRGRPDQWRQRGRDSRTLPGVKPRGARILGSATAILLRASILSSTAAACGPARTTPAAEPRAIAAPLAHEETLVDDGIADVPVTPAAAGPPALSNALPGSVRALLVPGFGAALVSIPPSGRPRPLLVATHGAGGRPDWYCSFWREVVAGRAFVLCPRGRPLNPHVSPEEMGYFYDGHFELEREVNASIAALEAEFAGQVDTRAITYVGFSQGATMGAHVIARAPDRFPRALLVEGGEAEWDIPTAAHYRAGGGARVLFACGREKCATTAQRSARWLERAGVPARALHIAGAGHTPGGRVGAAVAASLDWLVEGDERWKSE